MPGLLPTIMDNWGIWGPILLLQVCTSFTFSIFITFWIFYVYSHNHEWLDTKRGQSLWNTDNTKTKIDNINNITSIAYLYWLYCQITLTFNVAQCSISPITNDDGNVHDVKMILQKKALSISEEDRQLADFLLDQVIVFFFLFSFCLFLPSGYQIWLEKYKIAE